MELLSVRLIKALRGIIKTFRPVGNSTTWSNDEWYTFRILGALNELIDEFDPNHDITI
ncbi:MAG: hypothetical protein AB7V16_07245 [Vulcanibacillus sp.]